MVESIENKIKKLSEAAALSKDTLKNIFHFEDDYIILLCNIEGKNEAEKQLKATLVILTAYNHLYDKDRILSKDLVDKLKYLGIGSLVNLSTNLRKYRQYIIPLGKQGSSNFSYKITHPGIQKGLEIINELSVTGESSQSKQNSNKEDTSINLYYFESNKPYTSKKILSRQILETIKGEVKFVDPYCGDRTLDLLKSIKNNPIKILTNTKNLRNNERQFLNDLSDFRIENSSMNFEIRNYISRDLHDRYIITPDCLILIGHSIKDLGKKESFAIKLDKNMNETVYNDLNDNFDTRWKHATIL